MALRIITGACVFSLFPSYVQGLDPSSSPGSLSAGPVEICSVNSKVLNSTVIASSVLGVSFLVEIAAVAFLIFRRENKNWIPRWRDQLEVSPSFLADQKRHSGPPSTHRSSHRTKAQSLHPIITDLDLTAPPDKELPITPLSSPYEFDRESAGIEITIQQPSPLLHTTFAASAPSTAPGTPMRSSNAFTAGRQSWVRSNYADALTILRTPGTFSYPRSARASGFLPRVISMHAEQEAESADTVSSTSEAETDPFTLQQLVARLKARVRDLELQNEILRDADWRRSSLPSYRTDRTDISYFSDSP